MLPDLRVRQRDYLLEISRAITQELDLDKVLARILTISIEMLAGQAGLIALKKPEGWSVSAAHKIAPCIFLICGVAICCWRLVWLRNLNFLERPDLALLLCTARPALRPARSLLQRFPAPQSLRHYSPYLLMNRMVLSDE